MRPNIHSEGSVVSVALLVAILTAFLSSVAIPQEKIPANAGAERKAPAARELKGHADIVWAVALSPVRDGPTGGLLVSGGGGRFVPQGDQTFLGVGWEAGDKDFALRIWDPVTGEVRRKLEGHTAPVHAVTWSRDGSRIASADNDGAVRIWNAQTGELIRDIKAHTARASRVAFCRPDGSKFISGGRDSTLREFDVATGCEVRQFEGVHDAIWDVAVSRTTTRSPPAAWTTASTCGT
jgi:WD40 repeat protein